MWPGVFAPTPNSVFHAQTLFFLVLVLAMLSGGYAVRPCCALLLPVQPNDTCSCNGTHCVCETTCIDLSQTALVVPPTLTACVTRPVLTSAKLPSWSRQHRYELHTGGATPYMHLKRNAQVTEAVSSGYLAHFVHTCLTLTSRLICLG